MRIQTLIDARRLGQDAGPIELHSLFDSIWEISQADSELRRLYL